MATTKYGSTWTGTYSGAANRYFRAYCTYTTSETDTTFTLSVSALGIQKTSGGQCEMVSGASKTAKLTASGASVKSGSPISKSSTALISWGTGSQYKSLGSGSIVFNKTETAQTATLTLYADKSGGDTSTAWGGKSTGTFTITIPAITRTISFNANNGSGSPSAVKGQHGSTITLPTLNPIRTGYDFLGWATSSSATSAEYLSGDSYVVSGDTTLYAVWHVSFVAPKIEQLKAYRTNSASSNVASATGTYGYVSFAYTAPVAAQSVAIAVRFNTDSANKTISGPTTSGTKSAWGNSQISGTSSATITVTVSGKTYAGADFSISAQTYISPEINVWDAYIDGEIASFAIGGQASETESRHDVNIPAYFNNNADFNGTVNINGIPIKGCHKIRTSSTGEAGSYTYGAINKYMTSAHTVYLEEKVSEQQNGIILVWSAFSNGVPQNWAFNFTIVPKSFVSDDPGGGVSTFLIEGAPLAYAANKYMYIYDEYIVGHDSNYSAGTSATAIKYTNNRFVLRWVYGF